MSIQEVFEIKKNKSFLKYRYNSFDFFSINKKVYEILDLEFLCNKDEAEIIQEYDKICKDHSVDISLVRLKHENFSTRISFLNLGYQLTEMSYRVCKNISSIQDFDINKKNLISSNILNEKKDLDSLVEENFKYGRFLEDLKIPMFFSLRRFSFWVDDLYKNPEIDKIFLYKNQRLIGFMFYKIEGNIAHLLIGGIEKNFLHTSILFWNHVLNTIKINKINFVETLVSCCNLGVINLYRSLGFNFKEVFLGYHKHYR